MGWGAPRFHTPVPCTISSKEPTKEILYSSILLKSENHRKKQVFYFSSNLLHLHLERLIYKYNTHSFRDTEILIISHFQIVFYTFLSTYSKTFHFHIGFTFIVWVCLRGAPHLTPPLPHILPLPTSLPLLLGISSLSIGDSLKLYWGRTLTLYHHNPHAIGDELELCPKGDLICFQLMGIIGKNLAEWWKSCNFAAWIFENRRKIIINQWN